MKTGFQKRLQDDWHPDMDTSLLWTRKSERREVVRHYARAVGLSLLLGGAGFLAVLVVRYGFLA